MEVIPITGFAKSTKAANERRILLVIIDKNGYTLGILNGPAEWASINAKSTGESGLLGG